MPLQVEIFHEKRFLEVVATGPVNLSDMEAHFDRLVVENALGYAKLFDATMLEPVYSDADVLTLGARLSAYTAHFDSGPLAVIAKTDAGIDAFRRFVNISPSKRPAQFFASRRKAMAWLRQQPGFDHLV